MDNHARNVFLIETKKQAQMSLNAMSALGILDKRMRAGVGSQSIDSGLLHSEHFRTVHSFLTHLSNVSRLIWPPAFFNNRCDCKKSTELGRLCVRCISRARAVIIQEALGLVDAEHALRQRTLRDHLEHFDERLDEWQQTSVRRNIVQDFIGPKGSIRGIDDSDMMRQLDPETGDFTFRGQVYNLFFLLEGAKDVIRRTDAALKK